MKSKGRTPIKPVTKYKEAGCQTSPGFVKRTRQSNGDSASNTNAKDEEEVYKRYYIQKKVYLYMRMKAQGHLANKNFQTGFLIAGGGFLTFCNHQLIKFEEN